MARFTAPDLARLPPLPRLAPSFETIYAAYMADLAARLGKRGVNYDVGSLETDTYAITGEAFAYRAALVAASIDDAVSAVLLPNSYGSYLDALGANQTPSVGRLALVADPRPYVYNTPAAADWEADDDFRSRIQLAPEALSTCGPEGGYTFFARSAGAARVGVYGPMSFNGRAPLFFVPPGEVRIPILGYDGDGTAPAALVAAVQAAVSADDRRPIADLVTVSSAIVQGYTADATLFTGPGADPGILILTAYTRARAAADLAHRPAGSMLDQDLYAALKVPDANGVPIIGRVRLNGWTDVNGTDPTPAAPGPAYIAPYCPQPVDGAGITLTATDDGMTLVAGGFTLRLVVSND